MGGPLRPGIVHRLDKGTSGALIVARTNAAHRKLVEEFRERHVQKTYVALLHGRVKGEKGTIDLPVARDLHRRSRMTARRREGREARTDWRVRLRLGAFTLVEANLHTGGPTRFAFTFQRWVAPWSAIRCTARRARNASVRSCFPPLDRNFLHAARLAFVHPGTGQRIEVRAPLPPELIAYLKILGRAANTDANLIDSSLREFL